ncbi:MAG: NAD-dependent epimerase/dehydratase family protein [Candidatus Omnitrophica bacterium]|nr:NAD-dependent epimerase/dehydratase family protein [Candidatus Omnitrophota bacterium]
MIKGKKVFLSGGAGFIGSSLIKRIIEDNRIVVYDNLHRNALIHSKLLKHKNISFTKGDVLDIGKLTHSIRGSNMVVHLASIAGVDTVLSMPVKTMEVALLGTHNVLKAALNEKNIERFIDFSTSEVFGSFAFNVNETDPTSLGTVGEARWTYAVSKLATEHLALNYFREYGFPALSIRPFNIFGPLQVGMGAIHVFIKRALKNQPLHIHNEGSQVRSWCYIDDIIDGILLCLENKKAIGQAFNIGNPRNTLTIYHLANLIKRLCNSKSQITFVKKNIVDVELRIPNIEKARKMLGFEPKIDLEEGLIKTIAWYRRIGYER